VTLVLCNCLNNCDFSKSLACEGNTLNAVGNTLAQHAKLDQEAAFELLRIVESLAAVSISSSELKQFLMLLREDIEEKVLHVVTFLKFVLSS
jgi:hypothetical protein